jgi:hypothetical protein
MLDTMQGIRTIIDRQDLPPGMRQLVTKIEEQHGPLEKLDPAAEKEIREVLAYVDGAALCVAIVVALLTQVPDTGTRARQVVEPEKIESDAELWDRAKGTVPGLALLKCGGYYLAYDEQAERIAEATNEHLSHQSRRTIIGLPLGKQSEWTLKIAQANLEVYLIEQVEGEFRSTAILNDAPAPAPADPLDHDHNGAKGGSLAGDESTAHKGAVKKKTAKKKAAPKTKTAPAAPQQA